MAKWKSPFLVTARASLTQLIKKGESRLTSIDDQILTLYAKGITTRDIVATFKEMYGADVSSTLVSKITEAVMEKVTLWRSRPLE